MIRFDLYYPPVLPVESTAKFPFFSLPLRRFDLFPFALTQVQFDPDNARKI